MDNKNLKTIEFTKDDSLKIKGIAAIMIIFFHFFRSAKGFKIYSLIAVPFSNEMLMDLSALCKTGISLFTFITGYGLLKSIKDKKYNREEMSEWYVKRILKTMSGYYFIFVLMCIIMQLLSNEVKKNYFKKGIYKGIYKMIVDFLGLSNFFKFHPLRLSWWYMSAALLFILILPLIYKVVKRFGYLPVIIGIIALPRLFTVKYFNGVNPYPFILSLVIGMMFADYNIIEHIGNALPKSKVKRVLVSWILFGGATAFIIRLLLNIGYSTNWQVAYGLFTMACILFLKFCVVDIWGISHFFKLIGIYSMNIYLIQNFLRYGKLAKYVFKPRYCMVIFIEVLLITLVASILIEQFKKLIRYDKLINFIQNKIILAVKTLNN